MGGPRTGSGGFGALPPDPDPDPAHPAEQVADAKADPHHDYDDEVEKSRAPLLTHLIELRSRLIIVLAAIAAGFVLCFFLAKPIYNILLVPFYDAAIDAREKAVLAETRAGLESAKIDVDAIRLREGVIMVTLADPARAGEAAAVIGPALLRPPKGEPFARAVEAVPGGGVRVEPAVEALKLIFLEPLEFFFVKMKLAFFGGLVLAFPMIAYQVYRFVAPGLYRSERLAFLPYLVVSPALFMLGGALVYSFILPFVMSFALGQEQVEPGQAEITLLPRVAGYLSLVTTLMLAFGFAFQMPVILSLLARVEIITAAQLVSFRRYAIVGIFAFAAIVTPPDPLSQIGLGLAMMGLYEISIWTVRLIERRRAHDESKEAAAAAE